MKEMKNILIVLVLGALITCQVPANAQNWKSTSSMPGVGSTYTPQVTAVGATGVSEMATTTSISPYQPRQVLDGDGENPFSGGGSLPDNPTEPGTPLGDAVWPLLLMAIAACGVIALRRHKNAQSKA